MKSKLKLLVLPFLALVSVLAIGMAAPVNTVMANVAGTWTAPKFVVLGDSIAAEYGSIGNGYASIVARDQQYELNMLAVSGWTTHNVINQLRTDENAQQGVAEADIIQLVIGGNDLRVGKSGPAIDAIHQRCDYTLWEEHCDEIAARVATIVELVRELNPNAVFFVFNQYTPNVKSPLGLFAGIVFGATFSLTLTGSRLWSYAHNGTNGHIGAIPYWNSTFQRYLDENPGAFILVDADKAFRDVNNLNSHYMVDMIHPSGTGHQVLANLFNEVINEYNEENMVATPSAVVTKLKGNQNELTVTVVESFPLVAPIVYTETFMIDNNAEGYYEVGGYTVFVNTKGNVQIRDCYIAA